MLRDPNVHSLESRKFEGAYDRLIGYKIRADDPDPVSGRVDEMGEHQAAGLQVISGPAGNNQSPDGPILRKPRFPRKLRYTVSGPVPVLY